MCEFFVVPGNSHALLGMSGIEILYVSTSNCNTVDTHAKNEQIYSNTEDRW